MANLPQSGVQLVAQGADAYIGDLNKAANATDTFANGLGTASGKAGGFGEVVTGALRHIGTIAVDALGQAAMAVGGFLKDSVTGAADVEQTLAVMGVTSGATAAQLDQVRDAAIRLGGDLTLPATSAQDASEAMLELTKAGFTVDEAMAAAKGTLQLAAAAEISAGDAAAISASQINAFGLEAGDAAHVADLLTGAANAAQGTLTDMAAGFQQSGFAFHQAGQSIDTMAASVTALVKVGLTGSDAGTALKNALMRLMNPTDKAAGLMKDLGFSAYDAQGNMKPLETIIGELNGAMTGMTNQEKDAALGTIFLSDGMKAMTPLLAMGKDQFIALRDEVAKTGSAQALAGAQTQGFNGAIAGLQSQMETLQLIIGTKLLPLLTPLIQQVAGVASAIGEITMAAIDAGIGSTEFLESLGLLDSALGLTEGTLASAYITFTQVAGVIQGVLTDAITGVGIALTIAQPFFTALASTAQTAFDGIQAAVASVMPFILAVVSSVLTQVLAFWETNGAAIMAFVQTTWTTLNTIITTALQLIAAIVQGVLATVLLFIQEHGAQIQQVLTAAWQIISNVITAALAIIQGVIKAALAIMNGDWTAAWKAIQDMSETVVKAIYEIIKGALDIIAAFMGTSLKEIGATWDGNFKKLADAVAPYMKIAQDAVTSAVGAITTAFGGIAGAIQGAIDAVKKFIDAASKIKVPALVTPGSPTPLEIGMRGIADATREAAITFQAQLAPALTMVAMPAKAVMGAITTTTDNSRTVNYTANYGKGQDNALRDAFVARSMAL